MNTFFLGNYWFMLSLFFGLNKLQAQMATIPVLTETHAIVLQTDKDNRLRTVYFGERLKNETEYPFISDRFNFKNSLGISNSAYTPSGSWNFLEPAVRVVHSDGNTSLELKYVLHRSKELTENVLLTTILLKDPVYPVEVTLFYKVYVKENVIEQWAEIKHTEEKNISLNKIASANLYFTDNDIYLTTFHNRWGKEMEPHEVKLARGIRSIDSKLGSRTMLLQSPNFILSFGNPATENEGKVILGQLAWSGNFKLEFEIDPHNNLRLIAGINPYSSEYSLAPGKVFKTPSLIYTISESGTGNASRNLHEWARNYRVLDGKGDRLTLLNNWEATSFNFNENKITDLFVDAKKLGVDLFLLDDGWFGNKYPRDNAKAGLGDWQENVKKLPHGIAYLVKEAKKEGVKFGIWIEPEMVNPKSELYENHLNWVIRQPERPEMYYRNQLVLDLANPEVQDFVFGVVDRLFSENPELAFIKWDCNAVIFNAHSVYLQNQGLPQTHLYIEHVKGLYKILERIREKYPKVPMMLCAGGGGRGDYEILKYFTEFWLSDNTEPLERVFIQWNYSYFFPSIVTDNHVTGWGEQPVKFKVDVASMGKLGFDLVTGELDEKDFSFCRQAVDNYDSFKHVIWHGDLFRLVNPYSNDLASLMYVNKEKTKAVMFNYKVNARPEFHNIDSEPVRLNGLDAGKKYKVKETNLYPGTESKIDESRTYSGDFLMKIGINPHITNKRTSVVLEFTALDN